MEKRITNKKTGISYTLQGDYYIPDLILPAEGHEIDRFGRLHQKYLKEHKRLAYTELLTSGRMNAYLRDIDTQAQEMFDRLVMEYAERQGVTTFISGGALGFDQIAAALVIAKREMGQNIRLIFALPCKNQGELWSDEQKRLYYNLLAEADEIIYVSEEYSEGCMKKRNFYMVDRSANCICALLHPRSGTGQTVRYAREGGLRIINIAD